MSHELRFNLFKTSATHPYHWTLNSVANGQVICASENYARRADAVHAMELLQKHSAAAQIEDHTREA